MRRRARAVLLLAVLLLLYAMSPTAAWALVGVGLTAALVVMAAILVKRGVDVDELGSVSEHWIARHRVEAP